MRLCIFQDGCWVRFGGWRTGYAAALLVSLSPAAFSQQIPQGYQLEHYASLLQHNPFVLRTSDAPPKRPSAFDKLFLAGWSKDGDREAIFVRNSETNAVERLTTDPNSDNLRLVEIHPNKDARLVEALISDGSVHGVVKFNIANPETAAVRQVSNETVGQVIASELIKPSLPSRFNPGLQRIHQEGGLPRATISKGDARLRSSPDSRPGIR